jgi:restriction system protein
MAEITARRRGELVRAVFEVLLQHPDGLPAKNVLKQVEDEIEPTDYEKSDYPNRPGVRRFEKHVRFATIKAVKAGWLVKTKGQWSLTDEGRAAYRKYTDPERFEREAHLLYKQWADSRPEVESDDDEGGATPVAEATIEEAEENAWREVQDYLSTMPPYDFQRLVGALLGGMGYHVAWIAPLGKDGGIDILAHTDPLGTRGPRIKVQVKRQQAKVTVEGLRSFMALLGEQDVGLFVSTGGFSKDAETEARQQEKRQVTLVDLERLFDLWVEHYDRIAEKERALLPLRPIYYLAPTD